jgi:hypothetical protein
MSTLFSLPQEVLYSCANYLLANDDQNKKVFHFSYDWRNFMNTNQEYLAEWKKESQIISLKGKFTERFQKSSAFRSSIIHRIQYPRLQLELSFDPSNEIYQERVINSTQVNSMRKLHIDECKLSKIELLDVDEVLLRDCNVSDLSFCANVKKLTYDQSFDNKGSVDVSCLQRLEECSLTLDGLIKNLQRLSSLKKLTIDENDHISDVSCLRNVRKLSFTSCPNIRDVHWLADAHELGLFDCDGITDVSALGNIHTLHITSNNNIRDVSALKNVHTLDLSHCPNVTDVSPLVNVHSLTIQSFQGTDLSGLTKVVDLDISNSPNVADISGLTSVSVLNITTCPNIHEFTGLHCLRELIAHHFLVVASGMEIIHQLQTLRTGPEYFYGSPNPRKSNICIPELTNLKTLELRNCTSLRLFPSTLNNLRSLTIDNCDRLGFFPTLPSSLGQLSIKNCSYWTGFVLSGKQTFVSPIYRVEIQDCKWLKKIEIHRKVFCICESRNAIHCKEWKSLRRLIACAFMNALIYSQLLD